MAENAPTQDTCNRNCDQLPTEPSCVICLDSITEACEARPCGHRHFDYPCLLAWLARQSTCPLCKTSVHEVGSAFEAADGGDQPCRIHRVPQTRLDSSAELFLSPGLSDQERRADRLPTRRRRALAPGAQQLAIWRRRDIYRHNLYALHVGSNPLSQYKEIYPRRFELEPELVSRARAWLRRELQVFEFLQVPPCPQRSEGTMRRRRANPAEYLLEYIIAILKTVDIQDSQGHAETLLRDSLGRENARHLLHELKSFLRSPWSIEEWDRRVRYQSSIRPPAQESDWT
ncbi:hypothetical protein GGR56DRAFT_496274 [Xylariaceae sp. FL0804]|nr:hypothetical protein GGR56DRAFT_496274 [Xylariaceae sp. FL0804]